MVHVAGEFLPRGAGCDDVGNHGLVVVVVSAVVGAAGRA